MTATSRSRAKAAKAAKAATSPRRIEPRRIELGAPDLEIKVECLPEDCPIEGNALASGDDAADEACEDDIARQLNDGNQWAWCCVRVVVTYREVLEADDYLGCCSYRNEGDFREGGYYSDMVSVCLDELNAQLDRLVE